VPIVYTEARRLPKQRKENMETITALETYEDTTVVVIQTDAGKKQWLEIRIYRDGGYAVNTVRRYMATELASPRFWVADSLEILECHSELSTEAAADIDLEQVAIAAMLTK